MEKREFSIGRALGFGFNTIWRHLSTALLSTIVLLISSWGAWIVGLLLFPLIVLSGFIFVIFAPVAVLATLIGVVVFARSLHAGYLRMMLAAARAHTFDYHLIFKSFSYGLTYTLLDCFYFVPVLFGSIFFLIPGLMLSGRLRPAYCFAVDKNMGVFDALAASWKATRGSTLKLALYSCIVIGLYLLGAATVFGNIVTYPLITFTNTYIYRFFIGEIKE